MRLKSDYIFLPSPEIVRAALVAILFGVAQVAIKFDWAILGNWQTYAIALAAAAIQALIAFILGQLQPATTDSVKALTRGTDLSDRAVLLRSAFLKAVEETDISTFPRRKTLCNFNVDETNNVQRSSHTLREAPFCGKCIHDLLDVPDLPVTVAFTETGERRHFAYAVDANGARLSISQSGDPVDA